MNNSLKIVHASIAHSPDDDRILFRECLSLKQKYLDISIIGVGDKQNSPTKYENVNLLAIPRSSLKRMRRSVLEELRKSPPNIVHFHDPYLLPLIPQIKRSGIKIIYDSHENWVKMSYQLSKQNLLKKTMVSSVVWLWEKWYLPKCSGIVVVLPDLRTKFNYHKKIVELRNYPVLLKNSSKNEKLEQKILKFAKEDLRIVYVGQISRKREIELAVSTVRELNKQGLKTKLIVVGQLEMLDKSCFKQLFRENEDIVLYNPNIPHEEIQALLKICDIGWSVLAELPVFTKTLPNKNFEYMQAGLPFLSSKLELVSNIIKETGSGIVVEDRNAEHIANTIIELKKSGKLELMGQNGQKWFEKKYNWQSQEECLFNFYEEISDEA